MATSNKTFNSFSGVDMHAVFGNTQFGELQMVSYKSDREKAPVYTMGSPDPRTIARGKRLITGACIFIVFERDTLLETLNETVDKRPHLSVEETANYDVDGIIAPPGGSNNGINGAAGGNVGNVGGFTGAGSLTTKEKARLADQLLPFDITLVGANEYGQTTKMTINHVELMTEAGGISIDDLSIEKQMSFIARRIQNWTNGVNANSQ